VAERSYGTDISCYRVVPYRLGTEILLDLQQIIPLPQARDFQIHQKQKGAAAAAARATQDGRDYTRYDLTIGGKTFRRLNAKTSSRSAALNANSGAGSAASTCSTGDSGPPPHSPRCRASEGREPAPDQDLKEDGT
jgi:hypothetical protein